MAVGKADLVDVGRGIKDIWHPCGLQSLPDRRFVDVVGKILRGEHTLLALGSLPTGSEDRSLFDRFLISDVPLPKSVGLRAEVTSSHSLAGRLGASLAGGLGDEASGAWAAAV